MKEYATAAMKRRSVRKYNGERLSLEELALVEGKLGQLKPLCSEISVEFEIVPCSETNCKFDAEFCLLCYSENKPFWLENVGYLLEQWDLYLQSMDIGVCWYGFGRVEEKQRNGKTFAIMMCFGKCDKEQFRTSEKEFSRKSVKEKWTGEKYLNVAHIAHFAPSACNSQPWKVVEKENVLEVYKSGNVLSALAKQLSEWFNKMDMGIYLVFLEMALEKEGYTFSRRLSDKAPFAVYTIN